MSESTLHTPLPPQAVQAVQAALHAIPMNATVGVTITDVDVGWATVACADTLTYHNHLGTIHAGAQFLLIERLDTHYVNRASGSLTARAEARAGDLPAALSAFGTEGKARLTIQVGVHDGGRAGK